jgi:ATP-dependent protease HslVU (ClpYQ) peptidase subunit
MTCVAYRNGIIAADSMSVVEEVKLNNEVKVAKRKGHLFGLSGDAMPPLEEAIDWYFKKNRGTLKPYKFSLLVVTPEGKVYDIDQNNGQVAITAPFYAVGSGAIGAMCAMEVGATAEQAVAAAIKWCEGVGGKVVVRKLK